MYMNLYRRLSVYTQFVLENFTQIRKGVIYAVESHIPKDLAFLYSNIPRINQRWEVSDPAFCRIGGGGGAAYPKVSDMQKRGHKATQSVAHLGGYTQYKYFSYEGKGSVVPPPPITQNGWSTRKG